MDSKLPQPKLHLFICTNQRNAGECCAQKKALELFTSVKEAVRSDASLKEIVKVSKSGCLGLCSMGIAGVHYPEGKWLTDLKEGDTDMLLAEIRSKVAK